MWTMGQYVLSALTASVGNMFKKKGTKPTEYLKEPLFRKQLAAKAELSDAEKQREVDRFFAQEKARRVNWKRNHSKVDSEE